MKKTILLFSLILVSVVVNAYDFMSDGIYYNILSEEDKTCEVTYVYEWSEWESMYSGDINIPEQVTIDNETYTIVRIGERAFSSCQLDGLSLPSTITQIGSHAFDSCTGISLLSIPSNIEYIEDYSFYESDLSGSIYIPISCKCIGAYAFCRTDITELTFASQWIVDTKPRCTIKELAFGYCTSLNYVELNQLCYDFETNPFASCNNLNGFNSAYSVRMDDGTGYIVIDGCLYKFTEYNNTYNLELICCPAGKESFLSPNQYGIATPELLKTIGKCAFLGCHKITFLDLPPTVTSIEDWGLWIPVTDPWDDTYRRINIPVSVEIMGKEPFGWNSTNLDIYIYSTHITNINDQGSHGDGSKNGTIHIPYGTLASFGSELVKRNWNIIDDIGDKDYILEDGTVFENWMNRNGMDITYTRTFNNNKWQALYVPFAMSYDDWKDNFDVAEICNFHEYDDDENGVVDRTTLEVLYVKSGETKPNNPYLIRAKETGAKTLTVTNATLYSSEENSIDCSSVKTKYIFTGTYQGVNGEEMYNNGYYALSDGLLSEASSNSVSLGTFRWYLRTINRTDNQTNARANVLKIKVIGENDDMETGITKNGTTAKATGYNHSTEYYKLNGTRVSIPMSSSIIIERDHNGSIKKIIKNKR